MWSKFWKDFISEDQWRFPEIAPRQIERSLGNPGGGLLGTGTCGMDVAPQTETISRCGCFRLRFDCRGERLAFAYSGRRHFFGGSLVAWLFPVSCVRRREERALAA